ncbi:MAG: biotin synthase BioB, partial [Acidimicrobiales bacterium]
MSASDLFAAARHALLDERRQLTLDELAELAAPSDDDVPALAELAHEVRLAWCGDMVEIEGILSAKTGGCPEDCHFCSQSSRFDSPVKAVPLLGHDEVLAAARETAELGASEFCLVYAVRGPDERLMAHLEEVVPLVERETGLNVAVSAGILDDDQAGRLRAAGTHRYNHNL